MSRYLYAASVLEPTYLSFFPAGQCRWCGEVLTGRQRSFCAAVPSDEYPHAAPYQVCRARFFGYWWTIPAFKRAVLIRDDFTCQNCHLRPTADLDGVERPDISLLHCDHIVPYSKGGLTSMENLQTLCRSCNLRKGNRPDRLAQMVLPVTHGT